MQRRYSIAPKAVEFEPYFDPGPQLSITVFEPDAISKPTGILDPRGNMIYAQDCIGPIGFNRS